MALAVSTAQLIFNTDSGPTSFPNDSLATTIGGTAVLFLADNSTVRRYAIENDGSLTNAGNAGGGSNGMAATGFSDTPLRIYSIGDGVIDVLAAQPDGDLSLEQTIPEGGGIKLGEPTAIQAVVVGSNTFIVVVAPNYGGFQVFEVESDGDLTLTDERFDVDDTAFNLGGARALATAEVDGITYLFVGARLEHAINVYALDGDGNLTDQTHVVDDEDLLLERTHDLETVEHGGDSFLIATGRNEDGLSVFSIGTGGSLTLVDSMADGDDGVELAEARDLTTAVIDGVTYIIVTRGDTGSASEKKAIAATAENKNGVSIFTLDANANLVPVASIDTDNTEFGKGFQPVTAVINGKTYLSFPDSTGDSLFLMENDLIDAEAMAVQVAENTAAVTTIAKIDAADTAIFSITGGADMALFVVDPTTGAVSFAAAPDFEAPGDADKDNVYTVEVTADGIISETKTLTIEVTNVAGPTIKGTKKGETLTGTGEEETILGKNGKDKLLGLAAADTLDGGKHKDKLIGGDDADLFLFSTKLKDKWADKIKDFTVGEDQIGLDRGIFKKVGKAGDLKAKHFDTGKEADSGKDRILYQENKGWIRYDADGEGGDDAVKIAKVDKKLDLSAEDFIVVG